MRLCKHASCSHGSTSTTLIAHQSFKVTFVIIRVIMDVVIVGELLHLPFSSSSRQLLVRHVDKKTFTITPMKRKVMHGNDISCVSI